MLKGLYSLYRREWGLVIGTGFLMVFGLLMLRSIAEFVFPVYYGYVIAALLAFVFFSQIVFEILRSFSKYLYLFSIGLLILPIVVGEVTRGAVRWIPVGAFTIQPAEIVRPFLLVFFADFLTTKKELTVRRFFSSVGLFFIPFILILLQPSLGVAVLMAIGFGGVVLALKYDKKILLSALIIVAALTPLSWLFLAPYQKLRVRALINPYEDPYGIGYNSIQSKIAVGSGRLFGRGLGEGVQTQLAFLPERHTDFMFASAAEEMGFAGASLLMLALIFLLYQIILILADAKDFSSRAFTAGVFLTLFAQITIHIGMNMGLFPITGLPLPFVSAGGSSLVGTMIMMGMLVGIKR